MLNFLIKLMLNFLTKYVLQFFLKKLYIVEKVTLDVNGCEEMSCKINKAIFTPENHHLLDCLLLSCKIQFKGKRERAIISWNHFFAKKRERAIIS